MSASLVLPLRRSPLRCRAFISLDDWSWRDGKLLSVCGFEDGVRASLLVSVTPGGMRHRVKSSGFRCDFSSSIYRTEGNAGKIGKEARPTVTTFLSASRDRIVFWVKLW